MNNANTIKKQRSLKIKSQNHKNQKNTRSLNTLAKKRQNHIAKDQS